ncbi:MAG: 1-deoxy-D-xylulose-5-phosphate synthase [bacterium]|nr:1-deoxy-D-xylulose-5-phosphate synthase [bacterium]
MLLDNIQSPKDVAALPVDKLVFLAHEIREEIIRVCSNNGGHLASSLGAVDLTVAMFHVFPEECNRIVWDTGHQAYAHKLLTGRHKQFDTLRTMGGLCGFLNRDESPWDHFGAGHACTSISAALGFSQGAILRQDDARHTLAILGDGAATGGMTYEAINNACEHGGRMIVILNDNEMSISKNVGAISRVLTRLTATRTFLSIERSTWRALGRVPLIGRRLRNLASRTKFSLKHLVVPKNFFQDFGFRYYGPLDGHDIPLLVQTLIQLKRINLPVFLHILTKKGKGCSFAESNPTKYHGFAPFEPDTGEKRTNGEVPLPSYTDVFGATVCELARADKRILAISAAMPEGTGLQEFSQLYPERFFDVGIAEPHAVTFAAGLAADGFKPIVAIYSTFLQRSFDQIIHDVALQKLPVIFALDRAGLVGADGATHHGVLDLGYLRMAPGMVIMAPSDGEELRRMLATAAGHEQGPVAIRYPRGSVQPFDDQQPPEPLEIGRSVTAREGTGIHIWALGSMVGNAVKAAELLTEQGYDPLVVDARFVAPLDELRLRREAGAATMLITVEENGPIGGFGEAVNQFCREELADAPPLLHLALPGDFVGHGTHSQLLHKVQLDPEGIAGQILTALSKRQTNADGASGARI